MGLLHMQRQRRVVHATAAACCICNGSGVLRPAAYCNGSGVLHNGSGGHGSGGWTLWGAATAAACCICHSKGSSVLHLHMRRVEQRQVDPLGCSTGPRDEKITYDQSQEYKGT